jgi:hypothetical protein
MTLLKTEIQFAQNWNNKLNNKSFTTIRLHNPKKYIIGKEYDIILIQKKQINMQFSATIIDIKQIRIDQVNEYIARLDTGYSAEACQQMIRKMYWYSRINWDSQLLDFCLLLKK